METDSSIRMKCPGCGVVARGKDSHLNREIKCPKCGKVVRFRRVDSPQAPSPHPVRDAHANVVHEKGDPRKTADADVMRSAENTSINAFDTYLKIAAWVAGGGLLLLALSPFFKWSTFGSGGVIGISGDGKIVLRVTVLAIAAYVVAIVKGKWFTPVFLGVQAWGTLAVFWMGALVWKVGYILDSPDMRDNPFAGLFATQISPGAGLYLGLIGGIAIAGALGFIAVRRLLAAGNLKPYYATQGLSCLLGILLAVSLGPERSPESNDAALVPLFGSMEEAHKEALEGLKAARVRHALLNQEIANENVKAIDAQLGETFEIGNLEITPKTIELVTLKERSTYRGPKPRKYKSYVLTFVARNISEGQVFRALSTSSVVDNFGNKCSDPTGCTIEGNEESTDIGPGESATVMVAFIPALKSAKEYTWTIWTQISNQGDFEQWRLRFSPKGK